MRSTILLLAAMLAFPLASAVAGQDEDEPQVLRRCCECIYVPAYPEPFTILGDCVWVPADQPCVPPYMEPSECLNAWFVPDYVQPGDLVMMDTQDELSIWSIPGFWNDHAAIYMGGNDFVDAEGAGVGIRDFDSFHTWAKNFRFMRVATASASQRDGALQFALGQMGSAYQIPFDPPYLCRKIADPNDPNPTARLWYCTELVWAAYYSQGIDIDVNGWGPDPTLACVAGNDILNDNDIAFYPAGATPRTPPAPTGPTDVRRLDTCLYQTVGVNPANEDMYYQWDWGEYVGMWDLVSWGNHQTVHRLHTWAHVNVWNVHVRAKDIYGHVGSWSGPLQVTVRPRLGGPVYVPISDLGAVLTTPGTNESATMEP